MSNPESPEKIMSFRGAEIPKIEVDALQELEKLINKQFKKVKKFKADVFGATEMGFSTENQQITGIGLYNCGLSILPVSIGQLSLLRELILDSNNLTTLPESIGNLSSLQTLKLNRNNLTTLPESITKLESLQSLYLNNNQLTTLPESITKLESLQSLYLSNNQFTTLPESITKLESLQELNLGDNQLTTLPESITKLESLQSLYLSNNQFTTLPESITKLESLQSLYLSNNQLTTLPESITKLESLQKLNLGDNQLTTLPESMLNYNFLQKLGTHDFEKNTFNSNSFTQEFIDKCEAVALKGAPHEKKFFMKSVEQLEREVKKPSFKERIKNFAKDNYSSFIYAGGIAFIGLFTFLFLGILLLSINPVIILIFFIGALIINFFLGAAIIATLSGYFKKYVEAGVKAIKSTSSWTLDHFGDWIRRRLIGLFDVFVVFYLVWTIRAAVKTGFTVELIPAVNFAFEYVIPQWLLNVWALFGFNLKLSFLENLDLFLGHFYLKLFGIALAFWALYQYGFEYMRKTAFEEIENKNIWPFIVLGLFGAFSLAIMEYSNLKEFLSIGYSVGAIIGCCLFMWEINKDNPLGFFIYLALIGIGILTVWVLSLWNIVVSVVIGAVFVIAFFAVRWRIETTKICITYEKITAEQNKAMCDLQRTLKKPIPPEVEVGENTFGVKIEGENVVGLGLSSNQLSTLPESIGTLSSLQTLILHGNQLSTLPMSIGDLKSLQYLNLRSNQLRTLPESIDNLSSLEKLSLDYNQLKALPESIGDLKSLQYLNLMYNKLSTLPESIVNTKSLETLYLQNNKLSTLPESIGDLKLLQTLELRKNQLSTLPESIGNLTSLTGLYLSENELSTLPESIANMTSLKNLDISNNPLDSKAKSVVKQLIENGVDVSS